MNWLELVPAWGWAALAALVIGIAGGGWINGALWEARLADAQRDHAEQLQQWADLALAAQAEQRRIERERQVAVEEVQRDAEQQIELARADADRADDALSRLRQRFETAASSSRACGNSITAKLGEAADSAARMQADVLGRVGASAQLYAAEADRRGVAGRACQMAYESLK